MFEIILNNIISIPRDILTDFTVWWNNFFNTFEQPKFLEFLFYNEFIWFGFGVYLYIATGGEALWAIICTLMFLWLISKALIITFGIEVVYLLIIVLIITRCYLKRRRSKCQN